MKILTFNSIAFSSKMSQNVWVEWEHGLALPEAEIRSDALIRILNTQSISVHLYHVFPYHLCSEPKYKPCCMWILGHVLACQPLKQMPVNEELLLSTVGEKLCVMETLPLHKWEK